MDLNSRLLHRFEETRVAARRRNDLCDYNMNTAIFQKVNEGHKVFSN